jgi:alkanesulfonate monooxygenase SsuD/methylene tetrahydromethanopterin reductase-like flavin-dependent oxidoreductase (luciferase family)
VQVTDFSQYACTWGAEPPTVQEIVDVARRAEDLGFHSLQIPHVPVLPYPEERPPRGGIAGFIPDRYRQYQYDPLVLLPMLAQATSRIRIGFNVAVTPYLHPYVWAKYLASLDAATGGRVIAGFGLGYGPPQGRVPSLESVGIDGRQRGKMADEALELITRPLDCRRAARLRG